MINGNGFFSFHCRCFVLRSFFPFAFKFQSSQESVKLASKLFLSTSLEKYFYCDFFCAKKGTKCGTALCQSPQREEVRGEKMLN